MDWSTLAALLVGATVTLLSTGLLELFREWRSRESRKQEDERKTLEAIQSCAADVELQMRRFRARGMMSQDQIDENLDLLGASVMRMTVYASRTANEQVKQSVEAIHTAIETLADEDTEYQSIILAARKTTNVVGGILSHKGE